MFPTPRSPRYHSMDILRGLAALLVVLFHSTMYVESSGAHPLPQALIGFCHWGWVAVPMFFVLSGYGIAASADSFRRKAHSPRRFFIRRLRRVFPTFWLFLVGAILGVAATEYFWPGLLSDAKVPIDKPSSLNAMQWLGNFTLAELWREHLFGGEPNWFVGHVWTLAYEEQFYIVVGVLLLFARRRFFLAAGILTIVEILFRKTMSHFGLSMHIHGFFFDGQWEMFAAGMLVYYLVNYCNRLWQHAAVYATLLLMFALNLAGDKTKLTFPTAAWGFAFLMAALQPWEAKFADLRLAKPLVWCGTMCYSLYLVHWPITQAICHAFSLSGVTSPWMTVLVVLPVCLAVSFLVGWVFYLAVERRYLNTAPQALKSPGVEPVTLPLTQEAAQLVTGSAPEQVPVRT